MDLQRTKKSKFKHSEETKRKMSLADRGRKLSQKTEDKIRQENIQNFLKCKFIIIEDNHDYKININEKVELTYA